MPYITTPSAIRYPQLTLDDFLNAPFGAPVPQPVGHIGDTRTRFSDQSPVTPVKQLLRMTNVLRDFCERHHDLYEVPRPDLYRHFTIPKKNGKRRQIDAPHEPLMNALRELKGIFELELMASHHTSAFAYVPGRCALDAVKRHQLNDSKWVLKTDLTDFFPGTSFRFTMHMLSMIYPFNELMRYPASKEYLEKALDLCFLNGGLPQGTPISPMITNLIMIPIDFELSNSLRDFRGKHFIYTRYADDMDISCRTDFDWRAVCDEIRRVFSKFEAPYLLKNEKTHYGSRNGRNWMLGVMYNKDGQITLGYRRKKEFRTTLSDYIRRRDSKWPMDYHELLSLNGTIAYFRKVEPAYTDGCLKHYNEKFRINILQSLRSDIKNA